MTTLNAESRLLRFSIVRFMGNTLDSAWAIALPIYCASLGWDAKSMGILATTQGAADLLGVVLAAYAMSRWTPQRVKLAGDLTLSFCLALAATLLALGHFELALGVAIVFAITFLNALSFVTADTLFSSIRKEISSIKVQRWWVLSWSTAQVIGPSVGTFLLSVIGIFSVPAFNAINTVAVYFTTRNALPLMHEFKPEKKSWRRSTLDSFKVLAQSKTSAAAAIAAVLVKICFMAIAFLMFRAAQLGIDAKLLGIAGLMGGLASWSVSAFARPSERESMVGRFSLATLMMPTGIAWGFLGIEHWPSAWTVATALMIFSFSHGHYVLSFRVLRIRHEKVSDLPALLAGGGILARVGAPLGGATLPLLVDPSTRWVGIAAFWLGGVIWMSFAIRLMRRRVLAR